MLGALGLAIRQLAHGKASDTLEGARLKEVRQTAIDAIGTLTHILDEEHGSPKIGEVGCAHEMGQHGEVPSDQRPTSRSIDDLNEIFERRSRRGLLEHLKEHLEGGPCLAATSNLAHHWTVDGTEPSALIRRGEQRGDVGEPDDDPRVLDESVDDVVTEHSRRTVSPASCDQAADVGICERPSKLLRAKCVMAGEHAVVCSGEIAKSRDGVSFGKQCQATLEGCGIGDARWGNHCDNVAGTERCWKEYRIHE